MKQIQTEQLRNRLLTKKTYSHFLHENEEYITCDTFTVMLRKHIANSELDIPQIIEWSQIAKTYAYQIINGSKNPSRDKIIQLALALHLNLDVTNKLLQAGGKSNLYIKEQRDSIIMYCLLNPTKNPVQNTNELLYEYGCKIF